MEKKGKKRGKSTLINWTVSLQLSFLPMAHPRKYSGTHLAPRRGEEKDELAPPRPFFLAADSANRSSNSSLDNSSDSSDTPPVPTPTYRRAAAHTRRRSSIDQQPESPSSASTLLFKNHMPKSPPPSSFAFPFQAYPGNPDPGMGIPGLTRRRSSLDSVDLQQAASPSDGEIYHPLSNSPSVTDFRRPVAPFMADNAETGSLPRTSSSNSIYKQSAAANLHDPLPRNGSVHSFRAAFLSPASRPTSSLWAPPSYNNQLYPNSIPLVNASPNASTSALPVSGFSKSKPPLPSTRLAAPLDKSEKPWLAKPEPGARLSYFLTFVCIILGIAGAAALVYFGVTSVDILDPNSLCSVLDEQFSGNGLDDGTWTRDVELGGFGNGEFQMTTNSDDNLFLQNGELYIMPTLTTDKVSNILDGTKYTLDGCTTTNKTACSATANAALGTVINPVQSARINTKGKKNIKFGKVEFRAKLPVGCV